MFMCLFWRFIEDFLAAKLIVLEKIYIIFLMRHFSNVKDQKTKEHRPELVGIIWNCHKEYPVIDIDCFKKFLV